MAMQRRGNVEEEMIIPRTLEIKFGEEYSSIVYTTLLSLYCYSMTMQRSLQNDKYQKNRILYYV